MSGTTGRREQKKAATRAALQQAALAMFEERGFERTTVRDIAEAADVTERTFFRYFPSKEDLVLGEIHDLIPVLQQRVAARSAAEPPLTAVLNGLADVAGERDGGFAILFSGPPARFMTAPTRTGRLLLDFENALAETLRARLAAADNPEPAADDLDLRASVLARAAVAAMRSALIAYADREDEDGRHPDTIGGLMRAAFATLGA